MDATRAKKKSKDFDVRCAVVRQLLAEGVPRRDIRHEITLDTYSSAGRCDLAVLRDDSIIGVEIKSGTDKVDRLKDQCRAMNRCFDYVRIVIDTRLIDKLGDSFWTCGLSWYHHEAQCFVSGYSGEWQKQADPCLSRPDSWVSKHGNTADMAALLWKEEVCPITGSKTRDAALKWVRENMALKDLRPRVIEALRARVPNRWEAAFWRDFDALQEAAAA
jgi:hypothetical protein